MIVRVMGLWKCMSATTQKICTVSIKLNEWNNRWTDEIKEVVA